MVMQKLREGMASLREVSALIWTDATGFVRLRLVVALLLIMAASAMTALGPVALKLVVDGFTGQGSRAGTSAVTLIGLYVLSQWLARTVGEIRGLVYARAERRMSRMLSERLFAHVMRLPLRFHLERQTGAISQALDNGLNGYQMVLHTLVFTILPVATELGTLWWSCRAWIIPPSWGSFPGRWSLTLWCFGTPLIRSWLLPVRRRLLRSTLPLS
jgi:ABC-type multidrug transport system fused ATPase/permease subunit